MTSSKYSIEKFNVHGSLHRKSILIYIQQDATLHNILSENCFTCFGGYHHPSSGAQTTVSTASGICHTVTATCRIATGSSNGVTNLIRILCPESWSEFVQFSTFVLTLTGTLVRYEVQTVFEDIALDTAICRSPPIFSFTGEKYSNDHQQNIS